MPTDLLIVYDDFGRNMTPLAQAVEEGASGVSGTTVKRRLVQEATAEDMLAADGIILGSPNFSGISGRLKSWLDSDPMEVLWEGQPMRGKVGAAFVAGRSRNAGQEFTLLALLHVLWGYGMFVVGVPWSDLMLASSSYYGAASSRQLQDEDLAQARVLGERIARVTERLYGARQERL
jgi:NAD(P)H dehydrogenase (quinone)